MTLSNDGETPAVAEGSRLDVHFAPRARERPAARRARRMREALARFGAAGTALIFGSVAVWVLLLILVPHLMLIDYAFHANPGAIAQGPRAARAGRSTRSGRCSTRATISPSAPSSARCSPARVITALALVVCYPIAYYLAKVATHKWLSILMLCLLVPYWVNEVLRAYAWRVLMARNGLINQAAVGLGFEPIDFFNYELPVLDANIALFVGLIYSYILFMIFPMFSAMESLDTNQIEAARDLGASWARVHRQDRHPARQARHRLGLHRHLHADRRLLHRAGAAGRQLQLLVHPGDRIASSRC